MMKRNLKIPNRLVFHLPESRYVSDGIFFLKLILFNRYKDSSRPTIQTPSCVWNSTKACPDSKSYIEILMVQFMRKVLF
jgi:hypothetical protein